MRMREPAGIECWLLKLGRITDLRRYYRWMGLLSSQTENKKLTGFHCDSSSRKKWHNLTLESLCLSRMHGTYPATAANITRVPSR
jgi:hypothetical protein